MSVRAADGNWRHGTCTGRLEPDVSDGLPEYRFARTRRARGLPLDLDRREPRCRRSTPRDNAAIGKRLIVGLVLAATRPVTTEAIGIATRAAIASAHDAGTRRDGHRQLPFRRGEDQMSEVSAGAPIAPRQAR